MIIKATVFFTTISVWAIWSIRMTANNIITNTVNSLRTPVSIERTAVYLTSFCVSAPRKSIPDITAIYFAFLGEFTKSLSLWAAIICL